MAQLSDKYIKGFIKTCFEAGVHEKQAAAFLNVAIANKNAMEKSAAPLPKPSVLKGLQQLLYGAANIGAGIPVTIFDKGVGLGKLPLKAIKGYHDNIVMPNFKRSLKNKEYLNSLLHLGFFGGAVPAATIGGPLAIFQNWRANSDSHLADAVNDALGNPEFLTFNGSHSGGGDIPSGRFVNISGGGSSSASTKPTSSPQNIKGVVGYSGNTPGEAALAGSGEASVNGVPEEVAGNVQRLRALKKDLADLEGADATSVSAAVRARQGGSAARALRSEIENEKNQINAGLNSYNRGVAINNRNLAESRARAQRDLANLKKQDEYQSGIGYSNPDSWWKNGVNSGLELLHIRDTDQQAHDRAQDIIRAQQEVDKLKNTKELQEIDVPGMMRQING